MEIQKGFCQCGCGGKTTICKENRPKRGQFTGEPYRYIHGHSRRGKSYKKPPEDRFWKYVDKTSPDGCWNWVGGKSGFGYGLFRYGEKGRSAHRFSYEMFNGTIPDGLYVLHHCDNPPCVNPAHLFLGTHQDNMNDMCDKGRICRSLTIEKVRNIKKMIAEKTMPKRAIARMYGVNHGLINSIANGTKWKRA